MIYKVKDILEKLENEFRFSHIRFGTVQFKIMP